jgi:hypothetical protein
MSLWPRRSGNAVGSAHSTGIARRAGLLRAACDAEAIAVEPTSWAVWARDKCVDWHGVWLRVMGRAGRMHSILGEVESIVCGVPTGADGTAPACAQGESISPGSRASGADCGPAGTLSTISFGCINKVVVADLRPVGVTMVRDDHRHLVMLGLDPRIAAARELDRHASVPLAVLGSRPRTTMRGGSCHRERYILTHMGPPPPMPLEGRPPRWEHVFRPDT